MALSAKLQLKQSQSLVMTPQLMQSIQLLQYSNLELQEFIAGELEKNPLLEIDPTEIGQKSSDFRNDREPGPELSGEVRSDATDVVQTELSTQSAASESLNQPEMENVYDGGTSGADANNKADMNVSPVSSQGSTIGSSSSFNGSDSAYNLEAFVAERIGIQQYLIEQANLSLKEAVDRSIAEEIVASMEDDGYLRRDLLEIAKARDVELSQVETVLSVVQNLDPPGICARTIKECLEIQLRSRDRWDPMIQKLVEHLDLLAKREFDALLKICKCSKSDLQQMVLEIRALSPRPASQFDNAPVSEITPDVFVKSRPDGGWSIELNSDALPRVLVNQSYYAEVVDAVSDAESVTFVTDCLQNANWLLKSLDQRAQTILKVASEIVKLQDMFFAYGVEHLKPLNLKTVADNIKMHESTVSRVTSNKYIMTDRGIFEMKYFFSTAIADTSGGEAHSSEAVKHKIKSLISAETVENILSDDTLVELLSEEGITIARRTIAKYRESLNIQSSVQRRREKKNFQAVA